MSAKTNLVLDLAITTAFLVVSNPPLTGMAVHEWLGLSSPEPYLQASPRQDQNFFGRRPSPNFSQSRLPETRH